MPKDVTQKTQDIKDAKVKVSTQDEDAKSYQQEDACANLGELSYNRRIAKDAPWQDCFLTAIMGFRRTQDIGPGGFALKSKVEVRKAFA